MAAAPATDLLRPPRRTQATVVPTRWPGWIWAVPLAAVAVMAWLLVRAVSGRGITVTIVVDDARGLTANGTIVTYRGVEVGQVAGLSLPTDGRHVDVKLSLDNDMKSRLTTGTHFYLAGANVSIADLSSLKSVISGPTIELVPGPGAPARSYAGLPDAPPDGVQPIARYVIHPDGAAGDVRVGSPVSFRGFTVGEVTRVQLAYQPATGTLTTPVTIGLDPSRFGLSAVPAHSDTAAQRAMNVAVRRLVAAGLRARLVRTPPLIGQSRVALDIVTDQPPETLAMGDALPEIPTASNGSAQRLITHLSEVPIEQIGDNLRTITRRLRALLSTPELQGSIEHLDRTLATLDSTVRTVGPELPPMIAKLGATAAELDATATSIRRVTGTSAVSPNGNLEQALRELTDAARALRSLANFLDQHPEALIRGRSQ